MGDLARELRREWRGSMTVAWVRMALVRMEANARI